MVKVLFRSEGGRLTLGVPPLRGETWYPGPCDALVHSAGVGEGNDDCLAAECIARGGLLAAFLCSRSTAPLASNVLLRGGDSFREELPRSVEGGLEKALDPTVPAVRFFSTMGDTKLSSNPNGMLCLSAAETCGVGGGRVLEMKALVASASVVATAVWDDLVGGGDLIMVALLRELPQRSRLDAPPGGCDRGRKADPDDTLGGCRSTGLAWALYPG